MVKRIGSAAKEIKGLLSHFEERKERAKNRIALKDPKQKEWCFGLIGIDCTFKEHSIVENAITLRRVEDAPSEVELAGACSDSSIFGAVARYSHHIKYELSISQEGQAAFNIAWWVISLLRIKALSDVLVPVVASQSWSTIAGVEDRSCDIQILEDIPLAKRLSKARPISKRDLNWVDENLLRYANLLEQKNFRLAVSSLSTYNHQSNYSMCAASLWVGVEALLPVSQEVSFRISAYISAFLYPQGPKRWDCYKKVKTLYSVRSKIVHGQVINERDIKEHIAQTRELLSRIIRRIIELDKIPSEEDFNRLLFCGVKKPSVKVN